MADAEHEVALDQAIMVIAQNVLTGLADAAADNEWEMDPEVGEHDWEAIASKIMVLAGPVPSTSEVVEAEKFLAGRTTPVGRAES
jgi:hypothetical protein